MSISLIAILILVAFIAGVLKSGFAIGAGIFLTPILALIMNPKEAVALVAPMMLFTDIVAIWQYWGKWNKHDIFYLAVPCLLGAVLGAFLLNWFTPEIAKRAIGVIGLLYIGSELYRIVLKKRSGTPNIVWSTAIGVLGGITSALANSGGVFISTYLADRLSKQYFIGTLVVVFLGLNITKVSMFTGLGILDKDLWLIDLSLIPLMFVGGLAGKWVNNRINEKQFKQWIFVLIAVACLKLLFF